MKVSSGIESAGSLASDWGQPTHASTPPRPSRQTYYARPGYSFGVSYMCDESGSGISALAFASVRSDLLAFGNQEGALFILRLSSSNHALPSSSSTPSKHHDSQTHKNQQQDLGHQEEPSILRCSKIHALKITSLDWSFDNSQIFSVGEDGGVCFFEAVTGDCIRS